MQANSNTLYRSNIKSFPLSSSGKVRDIYNIDDKHLLIVTSDRLSAFDVILPDPIPGKGSILTEVSNFWFKRCRKIIPNHLSDLAIEDVIDKKVDDMTMREFRKFCLWTTMTPFFNLFTRIINGIQSIHH